MNFKISQFSRGIITLFILFIGSNYVIAQNYFSIENRTWDVCIKTSSTFSDTTCNYAWTYTFNSNGTFIESMNNTEHSVEIKQTKWRQKRRKLIFETTQEGKVISVQKIKAIWIDSSNFYTVEKNSLGIYIYKYYNAIN